MNLKDNWFNLQATDSLPVNLFPWLGAKDISTFAIALAKLSTLPLKANAPSAVPRDELAHLVTNFHQRIKTNTDNVIDGMSSFRDGQDVLRCAHQPNIFPALTILSLPILLSQLAIHLKNEKSLVNSPQVFFLLDYDIASDNRFRVAHFPSRYIKNGYWPIRVQGIKQFSNKAMFSVPRPNEKWLDEVFSEIRAHVLQEITGSVGFPIGRRELDDNISLCNEIARLALESSESLTEFNSFFFSLLVNCYWNLPTLFLPGHKALKKAEDHFIFLWDSSRDIYQAKISAAKLMDTYGFQIRDTLIGSQDQLNFWILCQCGERLSVNSSDIHYQIITAQCLKCGRAYQYKRNQHSRFRELVRSGQVLPRIVADDLFDIIAWGFNSGVSYIGSAEHYLFSMIVASELGIRPLPEFLWRSDLPKREYDRLFIPDRSKELSLDKREQLSNPIKNDIQFGKASCLYYFSMEHPRDVKSLVQGTL